MYVIYFAYICAYIICAYLFIYFVRMYTFLVNGEWRYYRSCAYMGEPGIEGDERFCLKRTGTYNVFMEFCTCNSKDGCNSSSVLTPHIILSSMCILISTFCLIF